MTLTGARPEHTSEFEEVAIAAAAGDRDALGELYERYSDDVYRWCLVRTGNHHTA